MAGRKKVEYPRVIYGPRGQSKTITGPDQWTPGWTPRPQKDGPSKQVKGAPIPLDRLTLKRRLRETGVPHDRNGSDAYLWGLLRG